VTVRDARRSTATAAASLLVPLLLLGLWNMMARCGWLPDQILPAPGVVLATLREFTASGELGDATLISLQRVAEGFLVGAGGGLLFGGAIGLSSRLNSLFGPTFLALAQVPLLAWMPLMILLVGIDEALKVILIGIATFIPVVLNVAQGVRDVPVALREVGRVLLFDPWSMVTQIVLPAAVPSIFTGLREGLANAWQTVIAVELFASSEGLGYMMSWGRQLFQLDLVLAVVAVLAVIGLSMNLGLTRLEGRLGRWQVRVP
jgi:sulfonate transport system permease protein